MDAAPVVEGNLSSEMEDTASSMVAVIIHVVGTLVNGDCLFFFVKKTCYHHVFWSKNLDCSGKFYPSPIFSFRRNESVRYNKIHYVYI